MEDKNDTLRGRFTAWLKVVVKRAKIDYIRKQNHIPKSVSLETIAEDEVCTYLNFDSNIKILDKFEFDNDNVAKAFLALSVLRQQILTLMFVRGMTAEQVAKILGRSVKHVFNEKSLALKQIRNYLGKK